MQNGLSKRSVRVKGTSNESVPIEAGSGNVFADIGLPNAQERLANVFWQITEIS